MDKFGVSGCFSKNTIEGFKIDKKLPLYLRIETDTCNGDPLRIFYDCDSLLRLNCEKIIRAYTYVASDKNKTNPINKSIYKTYILNENDSVVDISQETEYVFCPEEDQFILINGSIENINFNVSYIKAKAYCDENDKKIKYQ